MVSRPLHRDPPRLALVLVWLGTAAASLHDGGRHGQQLLLDAGVSAPLGLALTWAGGLWDLALGLWMAARASRIACLVALVGMAAMTVAATALLPGLWLNPFGPLLKNFALAALLAQGLQRR